MRWRKPPLKPYNKDSIKEILMNYKTALIITRQFQSNFTRCVNGSPYSHTEAEKVAYAEASKFLKTM